MLFPTTLPAATWSEFPAEGYAGPVWGAPYRASRPPTCGMPLGGIDTGCIDLEADGTLGFCTLFNSHVPRRGPLNLPFLGLNIGDQVWMLSTRRVELPYGTGPTMSDPALHAASEIHYWGHYPVADLEYVLDAPVGAALRAWTPFLPGDLAGSNTPGAVFELHLRNTSGRAQAGTVGFSFPGPTEAEAGGYPMRRRAVNGDGMAGIEVSGNRASYVLAVLDEPDVRTGGGLEVDGGAWYRIGYALPGTDGGASSALAVRFSLEPGAEKVIRFVLAWHSPRWYAGGTPDPEIKFSLPWFRHERQNDPNADGLGRAYTHMYAARFDSALAVASVLASEHESLLRRILAWQEVIYGDSSLPGWLRDSLVNNFHLITETGFWAQAQAPIGEWCRAEDGLWGMNEDPRHCPQIECLPCSFYGNYPVVLFFPALALSTLRGYRAYQYPNGEAAWIFGGITDKPPTPPVEMASPCRGYQTVLNGPCLVDLVYRYWLRTGERAVLAEMYDAVKRSTIFTMNLRPEAGPEGVISFPTGNVGLEWFEACTWAGMAAHAGGIHLANLRQAEAMAVEMGDEAFAAQCHAWFRQGSEAMEEKMWTGSYYLNYWDPSTGQRSDLVMANQLDGQWMTDLAGLPGVFAAERIPTVLETVRRACVTPTAYGAVNFATVEGRPTTSGEGMPGWNYNPYAFFAPEALMLGMTYMYAGEVDFGLELCRRTWADIVEQGLAWDQPNLISGRTGERLYGGDYYQNMMLWATPAAVQQGDLSGPCQSGGLVDRVIKAAAA